VLAVNRIELLSFYDDPTPTEKGMTATAVNSVAGEEFGLALLMRYFDDAGIAATVLPGPCTTGKKKGPRLDAWVETPDILYQVEIKNWSAHSFEGTHFPLTASEDQAVAHRRKIWYEYWTGETFTDAPAAKVLEPMKPPHDRKPVEPLIAFWEALHPEGSAISFFSVGVPSSQYFSRVHVFSMSTYLRSMQSEDLNLLMPKTRARLDVLDRIFRHLADDTSAKG